jgi:hypothetical protein
VKARDGDAGAMPGVTDGRSDSIRMQNLKYFFGPKPPKRRPGVLLERIYVGNRESIRESWRFQTVPSGMWLEFGGAISGNMKVSFQAARSIG